MDSKELSAIQRQAIPIGLQDRAWYAKPPYDHLVRLSDSCFQVLERLLHSSYQCSRLFLTFLRSTITTATLDHMHPFLPPPVSWRKKLKRRPASFQGHYISDVSIIGGVSSYLRQLSNVLTYHSLWKNNQFNLRI